MVKAQAGILETDPPDDAEREAGEAVAGASTTRRPRVAASRDLRPLVGLVGAEASWGRARRALRRLAASSSRSWPSSVRWCSSFEDLHWADDGLLDFVDHLVDWAAGVPLLVVVHGAARAARAAAGLGRRQAERDRRSRSRRSRTTRPRACSSTPARALGAPGRGAAVAARASGRQPALRRGVRAPARRSAARRSCAAGERAGHDRRAARRAAAPRRRRCCRTRRCSGRSSGSVRSSAIGGARPREVEERLHALARKEFVRRERRSSVEGEHRVRVPRTCSCATSRTARSRGGAERRSSAGRRSGSSRSAAPEDHAEMLGHHYLQALELGRGRGRRHRGAASSRRAARCATLATGRWRSTPSKPPGVSTRRRCELWPEDDAERPQLLLATRAVPRRRHVRRRPRALKQARDASSRPATGDRRSGRSDDRTGGLDAGARKTSLDEHGRRALEMVGDAPPSPSTAWVLGRCATMALRPVRRRAGCHARQAGARGGRASRLGRWRQRRARDDRVGASPGRRLRGHRGHRACDRGRTWDGCRPGALARP